MINSRNSAEARAILAAIERGPAGARSLLAALDRKIIAVEGFAEFVRRAWHVVEPTRALEWNWHLDEFCLHATLCMPPWREPDGSWAAPLIRDLVVNVPPGTTKSKIWSVLWPAWIWTWRPTARIITVSYGPGLSDDLAHQQHRLCTSEWYRDRWPDVMPDASQGFTRYSTNAGGWRFSTTVGGEMTGKHADLIILDDIVKPADADASVSDVSAAMAKATTMLGATAGSRTFDKLRFVTVLVMQRLADLDPSEHMLNRKGVVHLMFPALFEKDRRCVTPWGGDPRTAEGEPMGTATNLTYAAFSATAVDKFGGWDTPLASAQLQQRPSPPGGLMFKRANFGRFETIAYPHKKHFWIISIDANFKDSNEASDIGIVVMAADLPKIRVYATYSERGGFIRANELIRDILREFGHPKAILIEDKANGSAIIEGLRRVQKFPNVVPIKPLESKEARAQAANVYYEAHSVEHARDMRGTMGLEAFEHCLETFPRGRKKDVVDALAQGLLYLTSKDIEAWKRAINAWDAADRAHLGGLGFDDLYSIG